MKSFTLDDLREFVLSQPDERKVDMAAHSSGHHTGCLMVHFGKSRGFDGFYCGLRAAWETRDGRIFEFDKPIDHLFRFRNFFAFEGTYKTLKDKLK